MIGKKTSENWPIAKDETRVEENASANGTIRQAVLAELERTRNLFELMISSWYMVIAGHSGSCAMQIECVSHGGGVNRGELVWRNMLGRGHDFMHEHEQEECLPSLGC
jgi:hypothetical protein